MPMIAGIRPIHTVAVLAFDGVVLADLAIPCDMFSRVRLADGSKPYTVKVCSEREDVKAELVGINPRWRIASLRRADTVIIPGISNLKQLPSAAVRSAIVRAAERGARVASICTGAFILAATGLLDGKRATTHWAAAAQLARRHAAVDVDPRVLYVDNGSLLTSAGAAAGLDLCLHMIRLDHGADVAATVARVAVMPLSRDGGQAQFIVHEPPTEDGASLAPLLESLDRNLADAHPIESMAAEASMSARTLRRRFREQTGTTPARWLNQARVRRAQQLLETTVLPVEQIAAEVGFGSATTLRERFAQIVGTSPQSYRRSFGAA